MKKLKKRKKEDNYLDENEELWFNGEVIAS